MLCGLQAQTNFYQYLPAIILALAFLEGNAVLAPSYLYALGIIITVARLSHVTQLFFGPDTVPMPFRMAGALTTFLFLLATSTLLILLGLQVSVPSLLSALQHHCPDAMLHARGSTWALPAPALSPSWDCGYHPLSCSLPLQDLCPGQSLYCWRPSDFVASNEAGSPPQGLELRAQYVWRIGSV